MSFNFFFLNSYYILINFNSSSTITISDQFKEICDNKTVIPEAAKVQFGKW